MNIAINMGGGFGDILRVYFSGNCGFPWAQPYWGKMSKWVEKTGNELNVIVSSHNPYAVDFFEYIPWVSHTIKVPWRCERSDEVKKFLVDTHSVVRTFHELNALTNHLLWYMPNVYLTKEEKQLIEEIAQDDFVVLYPFGGYGARINSKKYLYLINQILRKGLKVVIIGGTHIRYTGGLDDKFIKETLDFKITDGVINVIGSGVRLCTALVLRSQAYIGSLGCYMHAALAVSIPSFVLTCYEVWDDTNLCNKNNQALQMLYKFTKDPQYNTELYVLLNEDKNTLKETFDMILTGLFFNITSGIYQIGRRKRKPVHV